MTTEAWPGNQEVEKSGGSPVEEAPSGEPGQPEPGPAEPSTERRGDTDQGGREPDEAGAREANVP
jgi:hypothetical protein